MKKTILKTITLTIVLFTVLLKVNAQVSFRQLIQGEKGKTRHFTSLSPTQQVSFVRSGVKKLLGLDAGADMVLMNIETDLLGGKHYRFYQTYLGIRVENTMYTMHVDKGRLNGMSGEMVLDFDKEMQQRARPLLTANSAIKAAIKYVNAKIYSWQPEQKKKHPEVQTGNLDATGYPSATLVWYSPGEEIDIHHLHLAYKIGVYAIQPLSRAHYFVDASSGKVLGKKNKLNFVDAVGLANTAYSGNQTIHSDFIAGTGYRLRDLTKGNGIITLTAGGADYFSPTASWNLSGANQAALDAHYGVSQTYSFYYQLFSRNSVDNAGLALTSYVNDPQANTRGAYWDVDSKVMRFGIVNNISITAIDVTAHELTHGITQVTSILDGNSEAKSIDESMSDIMGKSVQFWSKPTDINWVLGNDMNLPVRNLKDPRLIDNQPDTYKGPGWIDNNPDEHINDGVGNKMFYLLVNGGSAVNGIGNLYSVAGIGLGKADSIIYETEISGYLFQNAKYPDWRDACLIASGKLYGINSNEVNQVMNAWHAVGIGPAGFKVTAPNGGELFTQGSRQAITWDAAYTNYQPVLFPNVKISLSTDGGLTFPIVLEASTSNDGSESVTIPNVSTAKARIKIESVGNTFFDTSDHDFTIASVLPKFWFKADAGVISANGRVGYWEDQTDNHFDVRQPSDTYRPRLQQNVIGNKPAVYFNGYFGRNYLTSVLDPFIAGTARTIFVVGKIVCFAASNGIGPYPAAGGVLITFGKQSGNVNKINCLSISKTFDTTYIYSPGGAFGASNVKISNDNFVTAKKSFVATYLQPATGGSLSFRLNKNPKAATSRDKIVANTGSGFTIGDREDLPGQAWQGWIAEIIAFDGILSQHDVDQYENYLYNKYSIGQPEPPNNSDIVVKGNNEIISDGDYDPGTADFTHFGNVALDSSLEKTFNIEYPVNSSGTLNIEGITINGPDASTFKVVSQPAASLAPGETTSFTIRFTPVYLRDYNAVLHVKSDNCGKFDFDYAIKGMGVCSLNGPEINIQSDGVDIVINSIPEIDNNTDFGLVTLNTTISKTYTIENKGNLPLTIKFAGTNFSDEFKLSNLTTSLIAAGSSTTFTIQFTPGISGENNNYVTIQSDDCDEPFYGFAIKGTGIGCLSATWIGAVNDNFNEPANWCNGMVPGANSDVVINGGVLRFPQLNSDITIKSLKLNPGASLSVNGFTLTIVGP